MTLKQILWDGQTDGTTASSGLLTGNESFGVTAPSTMQFSTSDGMRSTSGLHLNISATGADFVRYAMTADNAQAAYSFVFRTPATNPSGFAPILNFRSTGGRAMNVGVASNGRFYVNDSANTTTYVSAASGGGAITGNTKYRCELRLVGNTTTAGKIDCSLYLPTDTTPLVTLTTITNANLRAELLHGVEVGNNAGAPVAIDFGIDDLQMDDGRTTEIGPILVQLTAPTVTLGTTTNPTTVGGTNGSQVVTWGAVSNATSYDAYIAAKSSPAQSDFTLVASGVTSPYTFSSLAAGTYSFGIMAQP